MATFVGPGETLYRSIDIDDVHPTEPWRVAASAFDDREQEPSVNQASIRPNAEAVKQADDCGVLLVLSDQVLAVVTSANDPKDKTKVHRTMVRHAPVGAQIGRPANPAHAVICMDPRSAKGPYRRWRADLASAVPADAVIIRPRPSLE